RAAPGPGGRRRHRVQVAGEHPHPGDPPHHHHDAVIGRENAVVLAPGILEGEIKRTHSVGPAHHGAVHQVVGDLDGAVLFGRDIDLYGGRVQKGTYVILLLGTRRDTVGDHEVQVR